MAGPITTLQATASEILQWTASRPDSVLGTVSSNLYLGAGAVFGVGASGIMPAVNQIVQIPISIPAGSSVVVDLSVARENVVGLVTATLARIYAAELLLPTVAQATALGLIVAGCSASSITFGANPTAPALLMGLADGNSRMDVTLGEGHQWLCTQGGGYLVNASQKNLLVVNNDTVAAANLLLVLFGNDA